VSIDLSDQSQRRALVQQMYADLDRASREVHAQEPRTHLGASVIADDCNAKIWGGFRWLKQEQFSGRMNRLFDRGHLEESRFVRYLKAMGFEIKEFDENGEQFGLKGCNGHFGGSLDGMAKAPTRYELPTDLVLLLEFKTHGENSFTKLAGKKPHYTSNETRTGGEGMRNSKPMHYGQMCAYGRAYSLNYGLYVAVDKDTDEWFFDIIPLDWNYADDLFRKADGIIRAQEQPQKISMTETFFKCKMCHLSGICFRGELPEKNCRSCVWAKPIEDGQWKCTNPKVTMWPNAEAIDKHFIPVGCGAWKPIINGGEK
jgi:hypothetical protein